jgi:hypothetical protein
MVTVSGANDFTVYSGAWIATGATVRTENRPRAKREARPDSSYRHIHHAPTRHDASFRMCDRTVASGDGRVGYRVLPM